jgi:hypothetical protein
VVGRVETPVVSKLGARKRAIPSGIQQAAEFEAAIADVT